MPFTHDMEPRSLTQDDFHRLDYSLMGLAFAAHKEMGRFCEERVYGEFLRHRWMLAGYGTAATEVAVTLSHGDYKKQPFIDLVLNDSVIYELKAVASLANEHQTQLLNYLFVSGFQYGKLINFRPTSVEHRFVSTRLILDRRREFEFDLSGFRSLSARCGSLIDCLEPLLHDWGVFLTSSLYVEALTHFLGGVPPSDDRVDIMDGGRTLGTQRFHLIDEEIAFRVTSVTKDITGYRTHLQRLLDHTRLRAMHWINLNRHNVTICTMT